MSMSPWLPWPLPPPGPSSVPHWLLHHFVVIAILFTAVDSSAVSSNQTDPLCANPSVFPHLMHTIGSIDNELYAISTDNWNVYKLEPCTGNDSIGHCMQVNPHSNARLPVSADSKWPKLVEAVKNAAHMADLNFPVNNSFVMDSSKFGHTVLIMDGSPFNPYFGFDFGTNQSFPTRHGIEVSPDLWISSDDKDKGYILFDSGKVFQLLYFLKDENFVSNNPNSTRFICNSTKQDGFEVTFQDSANCSLNVSWTVVKGVHTHNQFYFFAPDKVYIFSDKAQNESTKVQTVSYEDLFQCKNPTTLQPHRHSTQNSTKSSTSFTTHGHKVTTAKESNNTILIVVIAVVVIVVLLLIAVAVWYFYFHKKATKKVQNVEGPMLGAPSPASSLNSDISDIKLPNIDELKKASYERSDSRLGYAMEAKLFTKGPTSQAQPKVEFKLKVPRSEFGSKTIWSKDGIIPSEIPTRKVAPITKKKGGAGKKAQKSSQSKQTVHSKQSKSAVVKAKRSLKNPLPNKKAKSGLTMESEYPTPKTNPSSRTKVPKVYSKSKN